MCQTMLFPSWFGRSAIALFTAPLLVWLMSGTALAAAPSNDTFFAATPVVAPFSEVIDTSEATTDSDDTQLNAACGAPATDASVWYAFTAADTAVVVDVSQSTYSAGVLVGVGSQGNLVTVVCGAGSVQFFAAAGTTYYVLAIDDQSDGGGNGGGLNISFSEPPPPPPPPTLDITVNRLGRVDAYSGIATISGSYTCSNGDYIALYGDARQKVGRLFTIFGSFYFSDSGTCDGTPHPWSADAVPQSGKFAGGKTTVVVYAYTCNLVGCDDAQVAQTVQLRGGAKAASAGLDSIFLPSIPNHP